MKRIEIIALALAAGVAVSCGGGGTANLAEPYHISLVPTSTGVDTPFPTLSEMVDGIEYVKLEYVDGMPVGNVGGIPAFTDDYIVFFDNAQGILQFRRDGSFVRRVGHIGRGPGEYQALCGVYVNPARGTLHTLPMWGGNQTHIYDLDSGRFIETLTITDEDGEPMGGYDFMSFAPLTDDVLLTSQGRGTTFRFGPDPATIYSWRTIDVNTGRIASSRESPHYVDVALDYWTVRRSPTWRDSEGRVNVYENLADTIYVVGGDGVVAARVIPDFGSHKINSPDPDQPGITVDAALESKRWILFDVTPGGGESSTIALDKTTGLASASPERPINDIDGGPADLTSGDPDMWWGWWNAITMLERFTPEHFEQARETVKYPDRLEALQALVASLKEDDNPVIAIAKLK